MNDAKPGHGVMLTDDLIFFSRVSATARANGLTVRQARSVPVLLASLAKEPPSAIILDLQNETLDLPVLMDELKRTCFVMPRVIAYGSHVEAEVLRMARAAGCDRVMPRSQFVEQLEKSISEWFTATRVQ